MEAVHFFSHPPFLEFSRETTQHGVERQAVLRPPQFLIGSGAF